MKVMVVDPDVERRADLVDAICEVEHVEVTASTATALESRDVLAREHVDLVIASALSPGEATYLAALSDSARVELALASTRDDIIAVVALAVRMRHGGASQTFQELALRSKQVAFERATRAAGPTSLSHRLRAAQPAARPHPDAGAQRIDLREWLPRAILGMRPVLPDYVEVISLVAADTPMVRCVPKVLEHAVLELVLQAASILVWGGTIWLTAEATADGQVQLDVVENGSGRVRDLTLRAAPGAYS
jgi:hypothetical protein